MPDPRYEPAAEALAEGLSRLTEYGPHGMLPDTIVVTYTIFEKAEPSEAAREAMVRYFADVHGTVVVYGHRSVYAVASGVTTALGARVSLLMETRMGTCPPTCFCERAL